jgi:3-hydroxyisobutyrate dehydrogenase
LTPTTRCSRRSREIDQQQKDRRLSSLDFRHIGFVGIGAMGHPMAARLAADVQRMTVFDAVHGRAAEFADAYGVNAATDVRDLSEAELTILMLPDSDQVEKVLVSDGLLDALRDATLVIDMSSSNPARTAELATVVVGKGKEFLDAPVSGGVTGAHSGTLAIMVGGPAHTFARAEPVLRMIGSSVTHVGGPGAGHATKALNNVLSAIGLLGAAEVMAVGVKFGLDPDQLLAVLNGSSGRNYATETKFQRFVLSRAFDSGFSMKLMVKDISTALMLPGTSETSLLDSAMRSWQTALDALGEGADHTEIVKLVESLCHVELRSSSGSR